MDDYTALGYDKFLNKESTNGLDFNEQTDLNTDQIIGSFSGQKIDPNTMPGSGIIDGTLTNKKIAPSNRIVTAIVSKEANADFGNIQDALNFVHAQGGGKVIVLHGTYFVDQADTLFYSNTTIEGIDRENCIFDFNFSPFSLRMISDDNHISASDITITGITFRNCTNINGAIRVSGYAIGRIDKSVSSSKSSRVAIIYNRFISNVLDIGWQGINNCRIELNTSSGSQSFVSIESVSGYNYIVKNDISDISGYVFKNASQTIIAENSITNSLNTIFYGKFSFSFIENNFLLGYKSTYSAEIENTTQLKFDGNTSLNDLKFTNSSTNTIVNNVCGKISLVTSGKNRICNNQVVDTGCVVISDANNNVVTGNYFDSGGAAVAADGIKLTNCFGTVITGNYIVGSGQATSYAVNISDASSSQNTVVGNYLQAASGDTNDVGSFDVIAHNN